MGLQKRALLDIGLEGYRNLNMGKTVAEKIIGAHLVKGKMEAGSEIAIKIDHTLTQDATGTMVYLEFMAMKVPRVKTEVSVSYVDHNLLQTDFKNADDHRFLRTAAAKFGVIFSRPGNGVSHQVHLERFSVPGKTLLGSDSHTPTNGGMSMLAIGAGGLDIAMAMGGAPFYLNMPRIVGVRLIRSFAGMGFSERRHFGASASSICKGRRRKDLRVFWSWGRDSICNRQICNRKHGSRIGSYH